MSDTDQKNIMIKVNRILVPTDFSDIANEALNYAVELAQIQRAAVDIVHVFEEPTFPSFYGAGALMLYGQVPDIRKQAGEALEKLVQPHRKNSTISIETHLLDGRPADEICAFAKESDADLIVIPTYGLTGIRHLILGSVAERVVRQAYCTVVIYKNERSTES